MGTTIGANDGKNAATQATVRFGFPDTMNASQKPTMSAALTWGASRRSGHPTAHACSRDSSQAQVREWCEQVLVEVVLSARNSHWSEAQLALRSPSSFTAALLPRHLLHATLQRRLAQKLGVARSDHAEFTADARMAQRSHGRSRQPGSAPQQRHEPAKQAT